MAASSTPPFLYLAAEAGRHTPEAPLDHGNGGGDDGFMRDPYATKADLLDLSGRLEKGIETLRADLHKQDAAISKWMLGTVITVIGTVVLGFTGLYVNLAGTLRQATNPGPISQQAPPIIVNNIMPAAQSASTAAK